MAAPADQVVQARINGQVKEEAAAVLAAIGLTISDAVRLMLTKVAREKALPFDPLVPNETTIAAMRAARAGDLEPVTLEQIKADIQAAQAE
ncbi:MAG: type II toxin-antitoxin system RelB/DinJ family antitoxin [Pseudomonadales bacterium]|jgi:DNA-damage-inducible protein J|nr:type II toxin-antitoxin system RelB/DinJ family antitoxin [Pseudomonadales bacterium]